MAKQAAKTMGRDDLEQPASEQARRLEIYLAPIAVGLIAAFLAFQRLPKAARRTLWAEDGALFLAEALKGEHNLFAAYAGYLHVIPRALASVVVHLVPLRALGLGMNVGACLCTGLVAATVYVCAEDVVPRRLLRAWLALMTVLIPLLAVEVLANAANLHSVLMWGEFWVLLRHPRSLRGALALACFALLAALSEVQSVLLIPLALLVLWQHRSLRQSLVVGGLALGVACQMWSALTHEGGRHPHLLGPSVVAQLLGMEVAMPLWVLDPNHVRALIETYGWWLALAASLPFLVGLVFSFHYGSRAQRLVALVAAGLALSIFCISHMLNNMVPAGADARILHQAYVLTRYAVVPSLLLVALLAIGTAAAWHKQQRVPTWLGLGAMAALLVSSTLHFRTEQNKREFGAYWSMQIREARAKCERPESVEHYFRISPLSWHMAVPCSYVRERTGGPPP